MTNRLKTSAGVLLLLIASGCAAGSGGETSAPTLQTPPLEAEDVVLRTATGEVSGTLLAPVASSLRPVALIIAGSGPTDRDGNNTGLPGPNNSLRMLAEELGRRGVATLRYDKRGIGASAAAAASEADLRFGTYVEDSAAWVRRLQADPRFSSVTVIGHSEGSTIGALAAAQADADAFVSIAGIARPAAAILRDQLRPQLPPELWSQSERILAALEEGRQVEDVPQPLQALYRPSVQPYLISWFQVDPAAAVARLDVPVLIAQGTTDIQVAEAEARALHAARSGARLLMVEGMNHVLKVVPADPAAQMSSYSDPSLPVAPVLLDGIADFIRSLPVR